MHAGTDHCPPHHRRLGTAHTPSAAAAACRSAQVDSEGPQHPPPGGCWQPPAPPSSAGRLGPGWRPWAGSRPVHGCIRREAGGGGSETQKIVYQKWPESAFPFVNFIFSHCEIWVHGGGGVPPSSCGCQPFYYIPGHVAMSTFLSCAHTSAHVHVLCVDHITKCRASSRNRPMLLKLVFPRRDPGTI